MLNEKASRVARRVLYPLYKKLETDVHPLRYLFIEITQRCNLNCLHCGSDCTRDAGQDELSVDEWLAFFDALPAQIDTRRTILVVTGGEPLCCPGWDRILEGLKRNNLTWGMVTNGFGLTEARLRQAIAHGLVSITISLDGLPTSHDWLRGRERSFERAVSAIKRVVEAEVPFFDVVTCVNPRNLEELPQLKQLLHFLGVPAWRLFSIFPKGRAKDNAELLLSDAQLVQLLAWIAEERAALPEEFAMQFSCEGYLPGKIDAAVRDEPYFCRAGVSIASVLCDGAISGCPNISRSLVQGNIRDHTLKEIWERRFEPYRDRSWMQQGCCDGCEEWKRCQGSSMHLWDDEENETSRCFVEALW